MFGAPSWSDMRALSFAARDSNGFGAIPSCVCQIESGVLVDLRGR
jgi:hypothetical protein